MIAELTKPTLKVNGKSVKIDDILLKHFEDNDRKYTVGVTKPLNPGDSLSRKLVIYDPETNETFFGGPHYATCNSVLMDENGIYFLAVDDEESPAKIYDKEGNVILIEPDWIRQGRIARMKEFDLDNPHDCLRLSCSLDYVFGLDYYKKLGFSHSLYGFQK